MLPCLKKIFAFPSKPNENVNIRSIFKPLYVALSIVGLFPYSIKFQSHKLGVTIIEKSLYINALCSVSIILVLCSFLALHVQQVSSSIEDNSMTEGYMTQINYITELIGLLIFSLVAYMNAFLNRWKYVEMLNTVSSCIDSPIESKISERILKHLRFQMNCTVMGTLLFVTILQLSINFTRHDSIWKIVLVTITFNLPQTIQFVTLAFYYVLVIFDVALLKNIKEHLKTLMRDKKDITELFVRVETRQPLVTLRRMESLYVKALELKREINKAFQAPIMIALIQCFHSMVSECHIIYHGIGQNRIKTHEIVNCTIWVLYQILKVYALAISGSFLKLETLKLGQVLHNIPTEKQDTRLLVEVQHFSTLMSFQGNELTVYDYFPLDATLMFKVIASAVMYLIILVQFDKKT